MNSRRHVRALLAGVALAGALVTPALGADNGTVDATVTVATPCVLITNPDPAFSFIDYGTLAFSSGPTNVTSQRLIAYENCGQSSERIWGTGTDAAGTGANWQLSDDNTKNMCEFPVNTYTLSFAGTINTWLATTPKELEQLDGGAATSVGTVLSMPCVGSDGVGVAMSFRILLTATF
jgi:hypothetical protein